MSNSDQDQDIPTRLSNIDEQLEQLADELDLIRTVQNANRREVRANSQTAARLERAVNQLASVARDHQEALRVMERDREVFQAEIRRIWEYLLRQSGNGNAPPSNS
jgi:chromosome segregation ATPase